MPWRVYDYYHNLVKSGTAKADINNTAVIRPNPDVNKKGYFDVVVGSLLSFNTSFAVVEDNSWAFKQADNPFGVGTHYSQHVSTDDMELIVKLGARSIRDSGGSWAGVEKAKGVYNFTNQAPIWEQAQAHGLEPTMILAYSNPIYTW